MGVSGSSDRPVQLELQQMLERERSNKRIAACVSHSREGAHTQVVFARSLVRLLISLMSLAHTQTGEAARALSAFLFSTSK